mmetsp:Transcript_32301/g.30800  ORF Transcript_32301/g.30800 Transcript_32301/m.30800 type:complete len:97 (+) Transcript_32301:1032-1322(+)
MGRCYLLHIKRGNYLKNIMIHDEKMLYEKGAIETYKKCGSTILLNIYIPAYVGEELCSSRAEFVSLKTRYCCHVDGNREILFSIGSNLSTVNLVKN